MGSAQARGGFFVPSSGQKTLLSQCHFSLRRECEFRVSKLLRKPYRIVWVTCDGLPSHSAGSRNILLVLFMLQKVEIIKRKPVEPLARIQRPYCYIFAVDSWCNNLQKFSTCYIALADLGKGWAPFFRQKRPPLILEVWMIAHPHLFNGLDSLLHCFFGSEQWTINIVNRRFGSKIGTHAYVFQTALSNYIYRRRINFFINRISYF